MPHIFDFSENYIGVSVMPGDALDYDNAGGHSRKSYDIVSELCKEFVGRHLSLTGECPNICVQFTETRQVKSIKRYSELIAQKYIVSRTDMSMIPRSVGNNTALFQLGNAIGIIHTSRVIGCRANMCQ